MSDIIQTLKQRRQERDDAETAYQCALAAVREQLGGSFTLVDNVVPSTAVRDLPPEEWREGDFIECVDDNPNYCHKGGIYEVNEDPLRHTGAVRIKSDDDGDEGLSPLSSFRFHFRPGA